MLRAGGDIEGTREVAVEERAAVAFVLAADGVVKAIAVELFEGGFGRR